MTLRNGFGWLRLGRTRDANRVVGTTRAGPQSAGSAGSAGRAPSQRFQARCRSWFAFLPQVKQPKFFRLALDVNVADDVEFVLHGKFGLHGSAALPLFDYAFA